MRDVYGRFNPRELQAELSEGKVSKHKEIPRSPFPTRTYTRYLPTSMLLQRGNKIGRFRELDIGDAIASRKKREIVHLACHYPRRKIHLTGELAPERQGFAQSTPDQITRVGMDVCSTYSPNALSFGTSSTIARHRHLKVVSTTNAVIFAPMDFV